MLLRTIMDATGVWVLLAAAAISLAFGFVLGGLDRHTLGTTARGFLVLRIGVAMLLALDLFLFLVQLQTVIHLLTADPSHAVFYRIAIGVFLTVGLLLWLILKRPSLFPKDSGILLVADRSQQKKLTYCLIGVLLHALFYVALSVFLLWLIPVSNAGRLAVGLLMSVFALVGSLLYEKFSVNVVYERLETIVDRQYHAELRNFMQVIRSQRHDFNFHMQTVAGLIEEEKYDDCDLYIRTMVKNVERLNSTLPLHDPANSALVNVFVELAASKGIRLEVEVLNPMEEMPCTPYELNTILGNLLQNAIDEVESNAANDRWIKLLIMKRSQRHIIKLTNPTFKDQSEFADIFQPGYSTKHSHEGIGLVTVRRLLDRFGGTIYLEHEPNIVHFIAILPIRAKKKR